MRGPVLILAAALMCAAPPAFAADNSDFDVKTTRDLVDLCSVTEEHDLYAPAMGYCLGFIDAAIDYHDAITVGGDLVEPIACSEEDVTRGQVVDVFLAWAAGNDALLDAETPIHGLMRAASAKWPCS